MNKFEAAKLYEEWENTHGPMTIRDLTIFTEICLMLGFPIAEQMIKTRIGEYYENAKKYHINFFEYPHNGTAIFSMSYLFNFPYHKSFPLLKLVNSPGDFLYLFALKFPKLQKLITPFIFLNIMFNLSKIRVTTKNSSHFKYNYKTLYRYHYFKNPLPREFLLNLFIKLSTLNLGFFESVILMELKKRFNSWYWYEIMELCLDLPSNPCVRLMHEYYRTRYEIEDIALH